MAKNKSEIAKVADAGGVPAYLADIKTKHTGIEQMSAQALRIPRFVLLQGISPQLNDYPNMRKGQFFHSTNKEAYDAPLRIVPLHMKERCVIYRTEVMGRGIVTQASDGINWDEPDQEFEYQFDAKSPKFKFKTGKLVHGSKPTRFRTEWSEKPIATKQVEVIMAFPGQNIPPAVFVFQKSAHKYGEEWYSFFASNKKPLWMFYWNLAHSTKTEGTKNWLVPTMTRDGFVTAEDGKEYAASVDHFSEMAAANKLEYDDVAEAEETDSGATGTVNNEIVKKHQL